MRSALLVLVVVLLAAASGLQRSGLRRTSRILPAIAQREVNKELGSKSSFSYSGKICKIIEAAEDGKFKIRCEGEEDLITVAPSELKTYTAPVSKVIELPKAPEVDEHGCYIGMGMTLDGVFYECKERYYYDKVYRVEHSGKSYVLKLFSATEIAEVASSVNKGATASEYMCNMRAIDAKFVDGVKGKDKELYKDFPTITIKDNFKKSDFSAGWIVIDYIPGVHLHAKMDAKAKFATADLIQMLRSIAEVFVFLDGNTGGGEYPDDLHWENIMVDGTKGNMKFALIDVLLTKKNAGQIFNFAKGAPQGNHLTIKGAIETISSTDDLHDEGDNAKNAKIVDWLKDVDKLATGKDVIDSLTELERSL